MVCFPFRFLFPISSSEERWSPWVLKSCHVFPTVNTVDEQGRVLLKQPVHLMQNTTNASGHQAVCPFPSLKFWLVKVVTHYSSICYQELRHKTRFSSEFCQQYCQVFLNKQFLNDPNHLKSIPTHCVVLARQSVSAEKYRTLHYNVWLHVVQLQQTAPPHVWLKKITQQLLSKLLLQQLLQNAW